MIENCDITMENWMFQKQIQKNKENEDLLKLGFSTLFLNRTNRSGIIKGGMIGGKLQEGNYKLDCRFNKTEIINKIKLIGQFKDYIEVLSLDAKDLIENEILKSNPESTVIYFDPPYFEKAESLYMNYYKEIHHKEVSDSIFKIKNYKWIVSYDDHPFIEELYKDYRSKKYSFNHSAFSARDGKEILFFSDCLNIPDLSESNPINFKMRIIKGKKVIAYFSNQKRNKVA